MHDLPTTPPPLLSARLGSLFLAAILSLSLLFLMSGCDALGAEQTVILSDTEASFEYSFSGDEISTSGTNELLSDNTVAVDLAGVLQDRGFSMQDLRSITIDEATLQLTFPVQQQMDFARSVTVQLTAGDLSPTVVARRNQVPDGQRSITLQPESGKDVASYVRMPMTGVLRLEADQALSEGDYDMELTLQLAIEVGGL